MKRTNAPLSIPPGKRRAAIANGEKAAAWFFYGVGLGVAALGVLIWSYWPILLQLFKEWQNDDNYSVGQLVPLAALYLVWQERSALGKCRVTPCWWGAGLIVVAQAARLFGVLFLFESAERYAFVLTVAGAVLLLAGWQVFWRVRWILLFLFLMVPLPGRVHNMISGPMQGYATAGTVFLLELFGVVVARDGNVMVLNDVERVAVAEACSGLRMLTAFVVVSAVLAYIINRPRWQKVVLILSSVPIAIVCNLARLTATAVLYLAASSSIAETFFHDFAGVSMMPLAIVMLLGILWLMARLVIVDPPPADGAGEKPLRGKRESRKAPGAAV